MPFEEHLVPACWDGIGNLLGGSFCNRDDGEWHHLCGVHDPNGSGETFVYIDGTVQGHDQINDPNSPAVHVDSDSFMIGMSSVSNSEAFGGWIDDVRVYNTALSADEVETIADSLYEDVPHPEVDLTRDHIINFKDYAPAVENWLDEAFWP